MPKENQAFYVSKGVVFLALKIKNLHGSFADLKPLHIVYKADKVAVPLKFSSHSGIFDLVLYTFTNSPLEYAEMQPYFLNSKAAAVPIARGKVPALDKISGGRVGYLQRFEGKSYNYAERSIKLLKDDPSISSSFAVHGMSLLDYAAYLLPLLAAAPFIAIWRIRKSKSRRAT